MKELEKMEAIKDQAQAQGEFLDWLLCRYTLCEEVGDQFFPTTKSTQKLLAEYHNIDLAQINREKLEILEKLRGEK